MTTGQKGKNTYLRGRYRCNERDKKIMEINKNKA
jgi:hypothetical protein